MRIAVVSLFPLMLRDALAHGVLGRALERGVVEVDYFDPHDHTSDPHRTVDDRPYGGGPGMVLKVEPLRGALHAARAALPAGSRRVYLGADGRKFEQSRAREACGWPGLILVAGRYEGVDERFIEREIDEQWSIGDYVLSGGELPALVAIDAIARLGGRRCGARGVGRRGPCGDPALALAAGARPHLAAPPGAARAARHEQRGARAVGRIQARDLKRGLFGRWSGH